MSFNAESANAKRVKSFCQNRLCNYGIQVSFMDRRVIQNERLIFLHDLSLLSGLYSSAIILSISKNTEEILS